MQKPHCDCCDRIIVDWPKQCALVTIERGFNCEATIRVDKPQRDDLDLCASCLSDIASALYESLRAQAMKGQQ